MKFEPGDWLILKIKPVHEGQYELKPASGEPVIVGFQNREWQTSTTGFTHWRGLRLKGMEKTRSRRRVLDAYRMMKDDTYAPAVKSGMFLARHAVSLGFRFDAYRYYLIVNAIDPARLRDVDRQWIQRLLTNTSRPEENILAEQNKADQFFAQRGGRPRPNASSK